MAFPTLETATDAHDYHAVQLFAQGAKRIRPEIAFTPSDLAAITRICHQVQGMPLAILLAAAWIDLLSPQEIAEEIAKSLDFLSTELHDVPDRQRSIQALFAHSWQRLTESERTVFMKLAIFRGGFTRVAAQVVAGASLKLLNALVNKSLLQSQHNGRYTLHELLRQYAEERLMDAGQGVQVRTDHATYYSDFLHKREADIKGRRQLAALDEIEADFENVRAAWHWTVQQQNYAAIGKMLESLYWFCEMTSRYQNGWTMFHQACTALSPVAGEKAHPVWGQLMARIFERDMVYFVSGDEAIAQIHVSLTIAQAAGNQFEIALCNWQLGRIILHSNFESALAHYDQSLTYYQSVDDRFYMAVLLRAIGQLNALRGEKYTDCVEQSLSLRRDIGDLNGMIRSLNLLTYAHFFNGHFAEAEAHCREAYQIADELNDHFNMALNLIILAWLDSTIAGDFDSAYSLLKKAEPIVRELDNPRVNYGWLEQMGCLLGFLKTIASVSSFAKKQH
ncbi:MAG: hypothetical protein R2932_01555 [Caldilineaceae bacterium]